MKKALVAGGSGLVGGHLLNLLLADNYYDQVIAITRTPLELQHERLVNTLVNFDELTHADLTADDVYCCLGTTIRRAGSQEKFRKVDFDYPLALAIRLRQQQATQYLLVTALGADRNSGIFYNRVKGEIEAAIDQAGYPSYHIFQPSMLLGDRPEARAGEATGKMAMQFLDFLIPKKYKAIEAGKVAQAMYSVARKGQAGRHVHSSEEMQDY